MTPLPLDPTLLCREAEEWAEWCADKATVIRRPHYIGDLPTADALDRLASLLTQLSTLARAAGART